MKLVKELIKFLKYFFFHVVKPRKVFNIFYADIHKKNAEIVSKSQQLYKLVFKKLSEVKKKIKH